MNALDVTVQEAIRQAAESASADDDIAAVVLWGGERVFAAGADVKEMAAMSHRDMVGRSRALQSALTEVAMIPKPVVAAVTGYALGGGCELALCADYRVCASDAKLGQPEILLGIIPGAGGTQRLSRLVGPSRAKDLIFTGRFVDSAEAESMGLVDRVVDAADVYPVAREWALRFVGGPSLALRSAKAAIDRGIDVDLATGLEIEREHFAGLFATDDRAAGMQFFLDKAKGRAPFTGQ